MKSFGEKLIEVANVSYLSYCKLNSVGPYWVVHGPGPGGGPWTGGQCNVYTHFVVLPVVT